MGIVSRTRKFSTEHSDNIFGKIDQHLEKLLQKYKESRFYMKHRVLFKDTCNKKILLDGNGKWFR